MHTRRFSTFLLGAWLAASLLVAYVATQNFNQVDSIVRSAGRQAEREINDVGAERVKGLFHFHASEMNRDLFYYWGMFQVPLAIVVLLVLLFATEGNRLVLIASGATLAAILIQFVVAGQVTEIGRGLDFATADQMTEERRAFWGYHQFYSILEVIKILLLLGQSANLLYARGESKRRRRRSSKQVDTVDDADNGHVDR